MTATSERNPGAAHQDHPLLGAEAGQDPIAWHRDLAVSKEAFLHDVSAVAARLPRGRYAINLCKDRYRFLVAFAAVLVNGQTNLLPPDRVARLIDEIARDYSETYCLCDESITGISTPVHLLADIALRDDPGVAAAPIIPGKHLAVVIFTSGSTSRSRSNPKYWKDLVTGARMVQRRFGFGEQGERRAIVATVPPQHMYGLELSVLNALVNGVSVYAGSTLFPADIQAALQSVPSPRTLVTTPIHMRHCLHAGLDWPELDCVISATAPLDRTLAERAEQCFDCPVLEVYGCTEAGSLASRRTLAGDRWLLYEGSNLKSTSEGYSVSGPNLPEDTPLHDVLEPVGPRQFILHGRHEDMVKIAGKRASLNDLNRRLRDIDGVQDGVFVCSESDGQVASRLVAFVVAPTVHEGAIRTELARSMDPIFLPRPMYLVKSLPRNETGKLPREAVLALLREVRGEG